MLVKNFWVGAHSSGAPRNFCRNCWKLTFLTSSTKLTNVPSGCTYYIQKFSQRHFGSISWKNFLKIFLVPQFLQLLQFCLIWIFFFGRITSDYFKIFIFLFSWIRRTSKIPWSWTESDNFYKNDHVRFFSLELVYH